MYNDDTIPGVDKDIITTPIIMNQETIDMTLEIIDKNKHFIENNDCNIIKDIRSLGEHGITNKDISYMTFKNIMLKLNSLEDIRVQENVIDISINDCYIPEFKIINNNTADILVVKDSTINTLVLDNSRVKRVYLYNSKINSFMLLRSIIQRGVLLNYKTSIKSLYMNSSLIINTDKNNYNNIYSDSIRDAEDIIMDDKLTDIVKDRIRITNSYIVEEYEAKLTDKKAAREAREYNERGDNYER